MISDGQETALKQILLNYANNDDSSSYETIKAITSILGGNGEATLRDQFAMEAFKFLLTADIRLVPGATQLQVCKDAYEWADWMMEARK